MTEQSTPTPTETDPLAAFLESDALYEKDDGGGWGLNTLAAATAVRAAGWKSPAEVAELVRAAAEEAWDDCAVAITYDPNDPIANPHRKSISDRASRPVSNERII